MEIQFRNADVSREAQVAALLSTQALKRAFEELLPYAGDPRVADALAFLKSQCEQGNVKSQSEPGNVSPRKGAESGSLFSDKPPANNALERD